MKKLNFYLKKMFLYIVCTVMLLVYYKSAMKVQYSKALIFPKFIMIVLAIVIVWNAVDALIKANRQWKEENPSTGNNEDDVIRNRDAGNTFAKKYGKQIFVLISAFVFIILCQIIGFYVSTCVYIAVLAAFFGIKKWYVVIPVSLITTAFLYLAFTVYLGLRLPTGFLI